MCSDQTQTNTVVQLLRVCTDQGQKLVVRKGSGKGQEKRNEIYTHMQLPQTHSSKKSECCPKLLLSAYNPQNQAWVFDLPKLGNCVMPIVFHRHREECFKQLSTHW